MKSASGPASPSTHQGTAAASAATGVSAGCSATEFHALCAPALYCDRSCEVVLRRGVNMRQRSKQEFRFWVLLFALNVLMAQSSSDVQGRRGGGFVRASATVSVSPGNRAVNSEDDELEDGIDADDADVGMEGRRGGESVTNVETFAISVGNRAGNSEDEEDEDLLGEDSAKKQTHLVRTTNMKSNDKEDEGLLGEDSAKKETHRVIKSDEEDTHEQALQLGASESAACSVSAPDHGGMGSCGSSLASGSICQPSCNTGYTLSGGDYQKITGLKWCSGGDLDVGNIWGTGNDGPHCPLVGGMSHDLVLSKAKHECAQRASCKGFTAYEERICFRTDVLNRPTPGNAECYVKLGTTCSAGTLTKPTCSANPKWTKLGSGAMCRGAVTPSSGPPNYISQRGPGRTGEFEVKASSLYACQKACAKASSWGCKFISFCKNFHGKKYCYLHQDCKYRDVNAYYAIYSRKQANCKVGTWDGWSGCSKPCGGGEMTRSRAVVKAAEFGGTTCPSLTKKRGCNAHACSAFSDKEKTEYCAPYDKARSKVGIKEVPSLAHCKELCTGDCDAIAYSAATKMCNNYVKCVLKPSTVAVKAESYVFSTRLIGWFLQNGKKYRAKECPAPLVLILRDKKCALPDPVPAPKGMVWKAPMKPKSLPSKPGCKITQSSGIAMCSVPKKGQSKCGKFCCGCKKAFEVVSIEKSSSASCKVTAPRSRSSKHNDRALQEKTQKWVMACRALPEGQTAWGKIQRTGLMLAIKPGYSWGRKPPKTREMSPGCKQQDGVMWAQNDKVSQKKKEYRDGSAIHCGRKVVYSKRNKVLSSPFGKYCKNTGQNGQKGTLMKKAEEWAKACLPCQKGPSPPQHTLTKLALPQGFKWLPLHGKAAEAPREFRFRTGKCGGRFRIGVVYCKGSSSVALAYGDGTKKELQLGLTCTRGAKVRILVKGAQDLPNKCGCAAQYIRWQQRMERKVVVLMQGLAKRVMKLFNKVMWPIAPPFWVPPFSLQIRNKYCHIKLHLRIRACENAGAQRSMMFPQPGGTLTRPLTFKCGCATLHDVSLTSKVMYLKNTWPKTQTNCVKRVTALSTWVLRQMKTRRAIPHGNVAKEQATKLRVYAQYNLREMPSLMMQACTVRGEKLVKLKNKIKQAAIRKAAENTKKAAARAAAQKYKAAAAKEKAAEVKAKKARAAEAKSKDLAYKREMQARAAKYKRALATAAHNRQAAKRDAARARKALKNERRARELQRKASRKVDAEKIKAMLAKRKERQVKDWASEEGWNKEESNKHERHSKFRKRKRERATKRFARREKRAEGEGDAKMKTMKEINSKDNWVEKTKEAARAEMFQKKQTTLDEVFEKDRRAAVEVTRRKKRMKETIIQRKEKATKETSAFTKWLDEKVKKELSRKKNRHAKAKKQREATHKAEMKSKEELRKKKANAAQKQMKTANEEQRKVLEQEQMSKKLAKAEADEAADKIRISRKKEKASKARALEAADEYDVRESKQKQFRADQRMQDALLASQNARSRVAKEKAEIAQKKADSRDEVAQANVELANKGRAEAHTKRNRNKQEEKNAEVRSKNANAQKRKEIHAMEQDTERKYDQLKKSEEFKIKAALKLVKEKGTKKGTALGQKVLEKRRKKLYISTSKSVEIGMKAGLTNAEIIDSETFPTSNSQTANLASFP